MSDQSIRIDPPPRTLAEAVEALEGQIGTQIVLDRQRLAAGGVDWSAAAEWPDQPTTGAEALDLLASKLSAATRRDVWWSIHLDRVVIFVAQEHDPAVTVLYDVRDIVGGAQGDAAAQALTQRIASSVAQGWWRAGDERITAYRGNLSILAPHVVHREVMDLLMPGHTAP